MSIEQKKVERFPEAPDYTQTSDLFNKEFTKLKPDSLTSQNVYEAVHRALTELSRQTGMDYTLSAQDDYRRGFQRALDRVFAEVQERRTNNKNIAVDVTGATITFTFASEGDDVRNIVLGLDGATFRPRVVFSIHDDRDSGNKYKFTIYGGEDRVPAPRENTEHAWSDQVTEDLVTDTQAILAASNAMMTSSGLDHEGYLADSRSEE